MAIPSDPLGEYGQQAIGSEFFRFDTNVTDDDEFVNQRDLQVFARNHNMLMARGVRQPIFTISTLSDDAGDNFYVKMAAPVHYDRSSGYRLLNEVPIAFPRYTKACTFVVFAKRAIGTEDVFLYPVIDVHGESLRDIRTDSKLTIAASNSLTRTAVTVPVPSSAGDKGYGLFSVYVECLSYGSALKGSPGNPITDVSYNGPWIEQDTSAVAAYNVGNLIAVYDNTYTLRDDIDPMLVTKTQVSGTNKTKLYVDRPITGTITPGSDVLDSFNISVGMINTMCLYADAITDFDGDIDL